MTNQEKKPGPMPEDAAPAQPPSSPDVNQVAQAWSRKVIEASNRASVDEEFRKEIAKRIR